MSDEQPNNDNKREPPSNNLPSGEPIALPGPPTEPTTDQPAGQPVAVSPNESDGQLGTLGEDIDFDFSIETPEVAPNNDEDEKAKPTAGQTIKLAKGGNSMMKKLLKNWKFWAIVVVVLMATSVAAYKGLIPKPQATTAGENPVVSAINRLGANLNQRLDKLEGVATPKPPEENPVVQAINELGSCMMNRFDQLESHLTPPTSVEPAAMPESAKPLADEKANEALAAAKEAKAETTRLAGQVAALQKDRDELDEIAVKRIYAGQPSELVEGALNDGNRAIERQAREQLFGGLAPADSQLEGRVGQLETRVGGLEEQVQVNTNSIDDYRAALEELRHRRTIPFRRIARKDGS